MPTSLDPSFSRDGRPLSHWLLDIVSPDPARCEKALETLQAMQLGIPSAHTDISDLDETTVEQHRLLFRDEVQRAVLDPDFPGADFIRALAALIRGRFAEFTRQNQISFDRFDKVLDRYAKEQDSESRPGRKQRLGKALGADTRQNEAAAGAMVISGLASGIFQSLGAAILLAPDAVRSLMADRAHNWTAMEVLAAAGPKAAAEFLPDLLAIKDPQRDSSIMAALTSVGAGDPRIVRSACDELQAALTDARRDERTPPNHSEEFHRAFYDQHSAWDASAKLQRLGPSARAAPEVGPAVVPLLLQLSYSPKPGQRAAAAAALGACTRGDTSEQVNAVVNRLLALTRDHPWIVGRAIDALGDLAADPARTVPRLIELLGEYVEFDPDEGYNGEHSRIRRALAAFGPAAHEAIPALTAALERSATQKYPEFPREVFRTLRSLGASPGDLAPALTRMRSAAKHYDPENKQRWQQEIDDALSQLRAK